VSEGYPLDEAAELLEQGRLREACLLLDQMVSEGRGGVAARLMQITALQGCGDLAAALLAAQELVSLHPGAVEPALAFGGVLLAAGRPAEAIAEVQRALRADPENADARYLLGRAWLAAGEAARALDAFAALDSETIEGLAGSIAQAEAMAARPRFDAGYVRHLFDQFSTDYDERMLGPLAYRAPQILRELAGLVIPGRTGLSVLDLGCGTGLSGAAFRDRAATLDGIDLSPSMLEKARSRGTYDNLTLGDIESGFAPERYDLVVAADTLVYLGDLTAVMDVIAAALKPDGMFLFTVESQGESGPDYDLGPKRRWRHSESYLRDVAAASGFDVAGFLACVVRHDAGAAVAGFAVALCKLASPNPAQDK